MHIRCFFLAPGVPLGLGGRRGNPLAYPRSITDNAGRRFRLGAIMPLHTGPRHPLCPSCRYDLVATVEADGRVCPECGRAFELDELIRESRPDDWTVGRCLRRLAVHIGVRGLASFALWSLWVAGLGWMFDQLEASLLLGLVVAVANVIVGAVVGAVMWGRFYETVGADDALLVAVLIVATWAAIWLGSALIGLLGGIAPAPAGFAVLSGGVAATAVLVKRAFFSD